MKNNTVSSLNTLFKSVYGGKVKENMTPEEWSKHTPITAKDLELYENARISQTTLFQALDETEETEKRDMTKSLLSELVPEGVKLSNMIKFNQGKATNAYNQPVLIVNPNTYKVLKKGT